MHLPLPIAFLCVLSGCGLDLTSIQGVTWSTTSVATDTGAAPTTSGELSTTSTTLFQTSSNGDASTTPPEPLDPSTANATSSTSSEDTNTSETGEHSKCCAQMDLLFLVDQSWYPKAECFEDKLVSSLALFPHEGYDTLENNIESYHIGYTFTSDIPNQPPCQAMGSLSRGIVDVDAPEGCVPKLGGPFIDGEKVGNYHQFTNHLFCIMSLGGGEDIPSPRPVEAMIRAAAVSNSAPGACNEGFARSQAPLLIFALTSDDQDPEEDFLPPLEGPDKDNWWRILQEARGFDDGDVITGRERTGLILVSAPPDSQNPACTAEPVDRLGDFTGFFNPDKIRFYDLCDLNSPEYQDLGCGTYEGQPADAFRSFLLNSLEELICSLCED